MSHSTREYIHHLGPDVVFKAPGYRQLCGPLRKCHLKRSPLNVKGAILELATVSRGVGLSVGGGDCHATAERSIAQRASDIDPQQAKTWLERQTDTSRRQ
jgi:hypothetical protein